MSIRIRIHKIGGFLTATMLAMSLILFLFITPAFAAATWTVTNSRDAEGSASDITLRYAINHAQPGDTINFAESITGQCYYTTDGSDPVTSSTRKAYDGLIPISQTQTIKAVNHTSVGWSAVTSATFNIGGTDSLLEPVIFPYEGSFSGPQTVYIYGSGADWLYYTTDGSQPNPGNSSTYAFQGAFTPVTVSQSGTVKVIAKYGSLGLSNIASASFTIGGNSLLTAPVITPNGGSFSGPIMADIYNRCGTIYLSSSLPKINKDLAINGPGAEKLSISGNFRYRVFEIDGGRVSISGITVENGFARGNSGSDGYNGIAGGGGGGGGAAEGGGGLLIKGGTVTIDGVGFLYNQAVGGSGGNGGAGWTGDDDYGDGGNGGTSDLHESSTGGHGGIAPFPAVDFGIFQLSSDRPGSDASDGVYYGGGGGGSGINSDKEASGYSVGGHGGQDVNGTNGTGPNGGSFNPNGSKGGNGGSGGAASVINRYYYGGNGGNGGDAYGGAVCIISGAVQILNSSFLGNSAIGGMGGAGGISYQGMSNGQTLNSFIWSIGGTMLSGNRGEFEGFSWLANFGLSRVGNAFSFAAKSSTAYPFGGYPGNGGNGEGGAIYVSPNNSYFGWNGAPLVIVNSKFGDNGAYGGSPGPETNWTGISGSYGQWFADDIANKTNSSYIAVRNLTGVTSTLGDIRTLTGPHAMWSKITASSLSVEANGTSSVTITVSLHDSNNMPVLGDKVILNQGAGHSKITPASAITDNDGNAVFTVTNTKTETVAYTATDETNITISGKPLLIWDGYKNVQSTESTVTYKPGPPSAVKSTVSVDPSAVPSNGIDSAAVTVAIKDACGNPLSGKTVILGQGAGNSSISPASAITDSNGIATFTVTDTKAETVTYSAWVQWDNIGVSQTAAVTFSSYDWVVTSLDDDTEYINFGTLRYAMLNAPSGKTITFQNGLAGTIWLSDALPSINKDLTIAGPGSEILTISGNNSYRVFKVDGGTVTITGVTIANGWVAGSNGPNGYQVSTFGTYGENGISGFGGGLLVNNGTVSLDSVIFTGNAAVGGNGGNGSPPPPTCGTAGDGGFGADASGGAVFLANGSLTITNSTFDGNKANGGSGGIGANGGYMPGKGGHGGTGRGGAIFESGGSLTIANSKFINNSTTGGNGARAGGGIDPGYYAMNGWRETGGNGGNGLGGAVFVSAGTVNIINNTFSSNSASGGSGGYGIYRSGTAGYTTGLDLYNQSSTFAFGSVTFGSGTKSYYNSSPANAGQSSVTASLSSVNSDGASFSTITVMLKYANGEPVGCDKSVTLTPDKGSSKITALNNGITDSSGMVTFTVTDTKAETVSYTVTGGGVILTQTVSVAFLPADAVLSTVTASQIKVPADGVTSPKIIVILKYADGKPASGKTVTLNQGIGSSIILPSATATTDSNGAAAFTVSNAKPETVTYTVKDTTDNVTLSTIPSINFMPPDADMSTVEADLTNIEADGFSSVKITVTLKYFNGQPVPGKSIVLSQGDGSSSITPSATATTDINGTAAFTVTDLIAETVNYTVKDTTDNVTLIKTVTVTFKTHSWSVDTLDDGNTPGTLRYAITNAPAGTTITFQSGLTGTMVLSSQLPAINRNLTITGPGAANLTVSGNNQFPVFKIDSGTVSISGITIADGKSAGYDGWLGNDQWQGYGYINGYNSWQSGGGPGISGGDGRGGALLVMNGTVSVDGIVFKDNKATGGKGGDGNNSKWQSIAGWGGNGGSGSGGAVYLSAGTLTITNSRFDNNYAASGNGGNGGSNFYYGVGGSGGNGSGGAIFVNTGSLTIIGSLFSGNTVSSSIAGVNGSGTMAFYSSPAVSSGGINGGAYGSDIYNQSGLITVSNVTFDPGNNSFYNLSPADAGKSTVMASHSSVPANGTAFSSITVNLKDAQGNAVSEKAVTLTPGNGSSQISPAASAKTDKGGTVIFTVTDTKFETVYYTVKDTTDNVGLTQSTNITFLPPDANQSTVTASLTSVTADGAASSAITVTLKYANGDPAAGKTVTLTPDGGSSKISSSAVVTTDSSGIAVFTVTDTQAEQVKYTAKDTTDNVTVTQTVTISFLGIDIGKSTVTANPSNVPADGATASTITVSLKDPNGNPVSGKTVTLSQGTGSSNISPASTTTDNNGRAVFTVTDTKLETVTYKASDITDNATVAQEATVTFSSCDWTVNTLSDGNALGTLRYAIQNAQPGTTITFRGGLTGSIILSSPLPAINKNLTIDGSGAAVTVSGNNQFRVFEVDDGAVSIKNIAIAEGKNVGSHGTDRLNGSGTSGGDGRGGGLLIINGIVSIDNVEFSRNTAVGGEGGYGAIWNNGSTNYGGNGEGGAIYVTSGTLTISNCRFNGNSAIGGRGGNGGYYDGIYTPWSGNGGNGGNGDGGAMYINGGALIITNSQFDSNNATGGNGGISLYSGHNGGSGNAHGIDLYNKSGKVTLSSVVNGTGSIGYYTLSPFFTVTFDSQGGSPVSSIIISSGSSLNEPTAPIQAGYSFGGWYKEASCTNAWNFTNDTITGDITLHAKWTPVLYAVIVTANPLAGGSVSGGGKFRIGDNITVTASVYSGYTFTNWTEGGIQVAASAAYTFTMGTSDRNLSANFTAIPPVITHTVTFKDWNGTVLKTQTVNDGAAATAPGNPSRTGYTFTGWDVAFNNVKNDLTVTALYTINAPVVTDADKAAADKAAITWNTIRGANTAQDSVTSNLNLTVTGAVYGSTITWSSNNTAVVSNSGTVTRPAYANGDANVTVTAAVYNNGASASVNFTLKVLKLAPITHTVTFKDWNGTVLMTQTVNDGAVATAPANPTRTGYTYTGWDVMFNNVKNDLTVTALYTINAPVVTDADKAAADKAAITWNTIRGANTSQDSVTSNLNFTVAGAVYGSTITWSSSNTAVVSNSGTVTRPAYANGDANVTVTAAVYNNGASASVNFTLKVLKLVPITHTVTFKDWNGTVLKTQTVNDGTAATAPGNPNRTGYTFTGWDVMFSNVKNDLTVTALYTLNTPVVTDADKAAADKAAITWNTIRGANTSQDSVASNLNLTVTGAVYGSTITWSSSNNAVVSNSGTVTRPAYANGDANVTVTAVIYNNGAGASVNFSLKVLKLAQVTHTVTFKDWNGTVLKTQTVNDGAAATAPANPSRTGYTYTGWDAAFNNIKNDLTVTAQYSYNGGNSGGNSSSHNGGGEFTVTTPGAPSVPPAIVTETQPTGNTPPSVISTATTEAKSDSSGIASAAVSESQVTDAVNKAVAAAAQKAEDTQVKVEIKVNASADTKTVELTIPKAAFNMVTDSKIDALTVSTSVADITFDSKTFSAISNGAEGDVKISASRVDSSTLTEETKQTVGDRPVFNFSVTSGNDTISRFEGNVTISVPYTPKAGEDTNAIVIYYINANGKPETVANCAYDPATGSITFTTNHFSIYAVGYNKVSFKDVATDAWYAKAVGFIAARGVTSGTGDGNYSPESKLTRSAFIVMMMKAYGITPDGDPKDNFEDAGNTYYTGYLAAAKRLGISGGTGSNMFTPDKEITRQEMFTLLYNALKVIDRLPQGDTGKSLSEFSDAGQVAEWAKDAMDLMTKTGTINGIGGKLAPEDTTTRAQMAQVLYNLISK